MIYVRHRFTHGEVVFQLIQEFVRDESGSLSQSNQWIVMIHNGPNGSGQFESGFLWDVRDPERKIASFKTPEEALEAGLRYIRAKGLKDA